MIVMFALVTNLDTRQAGDLAQSLVGGSYGLVAVLTIVALRRVKQGVPSSAKWRPAMLTVLDYAFITTLAMLDVRRGDPFSPGQHVVAASIVLSFAVARYGVLHVLEAGLLAI